MATKNTDSSVKEFFTQKEKDLLDKLYLFPFSEAEKEQFLTVCERTQLCPLTKQIYAVPQRENTARPGEAPNWKNRLCIVVSIEGLRTIAERTGEYLGQTEPLWCGKSGQWSDVWLDDEQWPYAAKVGVRRKNFPEPLFAVARFNSFVQLTGKAGEKRPTPFWNKAPDNQLLKCAEAAALRKAFPQQLSGLYVEDEVRRFDEDENGTDPHAADGHRIANESKTDTPNWATSAHTPTETKAPEPEKPVTPPAVEEPKKKAVKPKTKDAGPIPPAKTSGDPNPAEQPPVQTQAPAPAPQPEKPATKDDPDLPWGDDTEPQQPVREARPECFNFRIEALNSEQYKGRLLNDLSDEELIHLKTSWIDTYSQKISQHPAKKELAENIIACLRHLGKI